MTDRAYTVVEVDKMRANVSALLGWNHFHRDPGFSNRVEDRLRTYLIAGTDPADLEAEALKAVEIRKEWTVKERARRAAERAASRPIEPPKIDIAPTPVSPDEGTYASIGVAAVGIIILLMITISWWLS